MFTNLIIAIGLGACLGVGTILPMEENNPQDTQVQLQAPRQYVNYNDNSYVITLTAYELNNYSWNNFNNWAYEFITEEGTGAIFDNQVAYNYDNYFSYDSEDEYTLNNLYYVKFIQTNYWIEFQHEDNNSYWYLYDISEDEYLTWEYNLELYFLSTSYNDAKTALELDIQANTQPSMMNPLVEIISLLTGGIVQFASGLGSGVSTLVEDIFLTNGNLSVFAAIVAVFAGISLAIGLSRWIMNYLTSLGAKK